MVSSLDSLNAKKNESIFLLNPQDNFEKSTILTAKHKEELAKSIDRYDMGSRASEDVQ